MNKELIIKLPKKIKTVMTAVKVISTAATVGMTVYSLIPKNEKIKGVNLDSYIAQSNSK